MLIFDYTKQYVLNPDLKFINNTNYLNTFLDIHIESFPIVTKYIEMKMNWKLSTYIIKYGLWDYKIYKIDNIIYIGIPLNNFLKIFPKAQKNITFYCKKCYKKKTSILNSIMKYISIQEIINNNPLCGSCLCERTCEEKYGKGITNPSQAPEIKEKTRQTLYKKYGKKVTSPFQIDEIKQRAKETLLKHYNVEYPIQAKEIKEKIINTTIEHFGVPCVFSDLNIREKSKETCKKKYGVPYANMNPEIIERRRKSNLENYGVKSTTQLPEVQEKMKRTMIERYGKENPGQVPEIKEKIKQTFITKYNVFNPSQVPEIRQKQLNTTFERYGVYYPQQSPKILAKTLKSMSKRGNAPTSKNQNHIFNLLTNINETVILNYPYKRFLLDIALVNSFIDIEYDGSGHDLSVQLGRITRSEFQQKEIKREIIIRQSGWKIIRIISKDDKLPNDKILLNMINLAREYLMNTNHTWVNIDLANRWFIFTKDRITINFDALKTIL